MQRLMEAEVRMHGLPAPTVSADDYRDLCLRRLCPSAEPAELVERLRMARQQAASLLEGGR